MLITLRFFPRLFDFPIYISFQVALRGDLLSPGSGGATVKLVYCFTSMVINKLFVVWFSIINKVSGVSVSPRAKKIKFFINV